MRRTLQSLAVSLLVSSAVPGAQAQADPAPPSILTGIELWLVANYGFAPANAPPALAFATDRWLVETRYGTATAVAPGDVVAVYDDASGTIHLGETWRGDTAADLSVLVHEYVHHLQAEAGLRFACSGEREVLAYEAQDAWLRLFGSDLKSAFGIDGALLLVSTACTY